MGFPSDLPETGTFGEVTAGEGEIIPGAPGFSFVTAQSSSSKRTPGEQIGQTL